MKQDKALLKLIHLIDKDQKEIILKGYAGTGKTYLIGMLIEHYILSSFKRIAVLAPTNQAVEVVRKKLPENKRLSLQTIHSYLKLKRKITRNGKMIFVKDNRNRDNEVEKVDLIIVDEASMIDKHLYDLLSKLNCITVYIGDPAQIPPIGESSSIPMSKQADVMLDEIIRQAQGSPIIERSMLVRNGQSLTKHLSQEGKDCIINPSEIDNYLVKFFNSEEFEKDAHYVKVLAWTNKVVDNYNSRIRYLLYGDINKITKGEKLVAAAPIAINNEGQEDFIKNNTELEVISYTVKYKKIKGQTIKYYYATVKDIYETSYDIKIIHEDSESTFDTILKSIKKDAIKYHSKQMWVDYYSIKESFAQVKYNYALTCHKSQGSTYNNVIIDYNDVSRNRDNRLLYTAITRASEADYYIYTWK